MTCPSNKRLISVHATMTPASSDLHIWDIEKRDRKAGFSQCGYHYIVCRDGRVEMGRHDNLPSVHDGADAKVCVSILLVGGNEGGVPTDNFTQQQKQVFKQLVESLPNQHPGVREEGGYRLVSRTPSVSDDELVSWVS